MVLTNYIQPTLGIGQTTEIKKRIIYGGGIVVNKEHCKYVYTFTVNYKGSFMKVQ